MGKHGLDTHMVAVFQQAGFARQQALGTAEVVAHRGIDPGQLLLDQRADHQLAVLGHDLEAVVEDGHGGVHVQAGLAGHPVGDGRHALHLGQTQQAEQADPRPAHVELPAFDRELGRVGVGVVVIVQFFTADDDAPGHQVGGGVAAFEVAIAQGMAQAVDHPGGPERNPHHLHRPDGDAQGAEQQQVDHRHQCDTAQFVTRVQVALDPVIRAVLAIDAQGFGVARLFTVQLGTFAQHRAQALVHRAVRVVGGFALGVVLAVDGSPLAGVLRRGQPQPETEEMLERAVELQRPVRGVAVQIDSNADDGHVGHQQSDGDQLPGRQVEQAVVPHRCRNPRGNRGSADYPLAGK
ncbi:hypothetical protein D3C76_980100 [compost metagenome]